MNVYGDKAVTTNEFNYFIKGKLLWESCLIAP